MKNLTQKTFNDVEEILHSAVQRGVTITEACATLDKNPALMAGILKKIEAAYKGGLIKENKRNTLVELFNKTQKKKNVINTKPTSRGLTKSSKGSSKNNSSYSTQDELELEEEINLTRQELEMLEYDAESDDKYEDRSVGESVRDGDTFVDKDGNKLRQITGYKYKVFIKGERALTGEFTREEMDKIYRLYSSMDGAGLTLRAVSREFSFLNYRDFKRILRAFNITKASLPIAPHILEECSEDESVALVRRNKENNILKKLDIDRQKYYEKKFFETRKEIVDIKSNSEWIERVINSYFDKNRSALSFPSSGLMKSSKSTKSAKSGKSDDKTDKPLYCIFGDIHYGKKFDNPVFGRGYNKDIAHERMMEIAKYTIDEAKLLKTKEIIMVCLGDLIECALEDGMHPGHSQEMDLFQEDQIFFAIDSIISVIKEILNNTDSKLTFCSIHGNHDRLGIGRDDDKSRTAGKIITGMIKRLMEKEKRIEVVMPKNNLLKLVRGKICLFAQHGDSSLNKKKPSELVNLFGEGTSHYHLLLKGHWHSLKADEGTNFLTLTAPSVCSADKYIMEELGNNNLPGFILGHEPNCYGFNYRKITLY